MHGGKRKGLPVETILRIGGPVTPDSQSEYCVENQAGDTG